MSESQSEAVGPAAEALVQRAGSSACGGFLPIPDVWGQDSHWIPVSPGRGWRFAEALRGSQAPEPPGGGRRPGAGPSRSPFLPSPRSVVRAPALEPALVMRSRSFLMSVDKAPYA